MVAALTLLGAGDQRDLYLYDTFEGMPPPGDVDRSPVLGKHADELLTLDDDVGASDAGRRRSGRGAGESGTHRVSERAASLRRRQCRGPVPGTAPDRIAVLRLDTA